MLRTLKGWQHFYFAYLYKKEKMKREYYFPRYTYNDYKNWKEDWELVDGYPLQLLPSASPKHSLVQGKIVYQGNLSISHNNDSCNCVLFVELDWKINDNTVVRPDVMIVCGEPKEEYLSFPPVLIVEILSPHNMQRDRVLKFDIYKEQGVKFYLMVDPLKEAVEVFELIDNTYKQVEKDSFRVDKNCEVRFDYNLLWK